MHWSPTDKETFVSSSWDTTLKIVRPGRPRPSLLDVVCNWYLVRCVYLWVLVLFVLAGESVVANCSGILIGGIV